MLSPLSIRRFDPVAFRQLPVIQKIIADETWLEGERRHCPVTADDPVVRENVCQVILRIGAALRATFSRNSDDDGPTTPFPPTSHPHAA